MSKLTRACNKLIKMGVFPKYHVLDVLKLHEDGDIDVYKLVDNFEKKDYEKENL